MTEPLARHKDGHLNTKTYLGMKKGTNMIVLCKILYEFGIPLGKLGGFLRERYPRGIYDRQVIPKDLQNLNATDTIVCAPRHNTLQSNT